MRTALIALLACCLSPVLRLNGQNLKLPVSNYSNKIYGRGYDAANRCILAGREGLIYSGNASGILEYDGSAWRYIPVRQGAYVTSLAEDDAGRIYVGSQNEFGYLDPDATGTLVYRSLSDSLDDFDRFFNVVWYTHVSPGRVFFQSEEILFVFENGKILPIYPETSFHTSFLVDGRLYVRERDRGLMVLEGQELVPVPGGDLFSELGIFGMLPMDNEGGIFIATREKGFYTWHSERGFAKTGNEYEGFLRNAGITGGMRLADGNFAFNTLFEGVVVTDPGGDIRTIVNEHSGLQVNDIKAISQDAWGNIWCAMGNGIGKINYESPVSFYHENAGLEGSVHTAARYGGRLWVGTTTGLFMENPFRSVSLSLDFSPVSAIRDQVWDLIPLAGSMAIATGNGLYRLTGEILTQISDENSFVLHYLEDDGLLLIGGNTGLSAYRMAGTWSKVLDFPEINMDVKAITVNPSGLYRETEIWLGSGYQGAARILVSKDLSYTVTFYQGEGDGLTGDWVLPMVHNDSLVFGTRIGLLRFVDELVVREALPDSIRDLPEYNRGYFEPGFLAGAPVLLPVNYVRDIGDRTWAVIDNEIIIADLENPGEPIRTPFKQIDLGWINSLFIENGIIAWICAADGLARFDLSALPEAERGFQASVRQVMISGDSLIYNGAGRQVAPVISSGYNDVQFTFSCPYYHDETRNRFSWRLVGMSDEWTDLSGRRITTYTNLHEGSYEFQLRAENIFGNLSPTATYTFTVSPPWFRTTLAFIVYMLLAAGFIFMSVRLGQRRLRRKNERLEAIVRERTAEIRQQNLELARQKQEITDSIYYAERIQRAILPQTDRIASLISEYFILFKPKDIVSGDFYWLAENGEKIIIAAVDCTGHGVPGAFMSMLGVSFLNKIILENNTLEADRILNELRDNVISSLKQTGKEGEARDGMDMALVVIDMKKMSMEFAGANNPLYMVRGEALNETKADRMPIAYHLRSDDFSVQTVPLEKGDCYYLFSDGYADQFGGPEGKKFKYRAFKQLLLENQQKSMDEQKIILDETIEKWKAGPGSDGNPYDQVDDILVIGIRI